MFHRIESVEALPNFGLSVRFLAGPEKIYDIRPIMETHEAFRAFRLTRGLFEQAKVAAGGYGVYWNDDIDISCNELYENGKSMSGPGV